MTLLQLFVAALTLVGNAFFVSGEFSLVSVRRSQIEPLAERGERRARTVVWALEHVSVLMATAQLGITVCTLVLGAVSEPAITHLLEPLFRAASVPDRAARPTAFALALAAATYLHMLFGEMVPKNIALAAPVRTALAVGPALVTLTRVLRPLVLGVNGAANAGLRILRVEPRSEVASAFSDAELARMVTDARRAGLLDQRATTRVREAMEFTRRPVGAVARPVGDVVGARLGVTPRELEDLAARSGFSRFPVIGDDGRTLGFLHVKDALEAAGDDEPFTAADLRAVIRLSERTALDEALTAMRGRRAHLAEVVDDSGRTTGMVTMDDMLRELVASRPRER